MKARARTALLLLVILVVAAFSAEAQEYRIVDIEVVGNRAASKSLIMGVSSLEKGEELSATDVTATIRRLYGLGIFSDVRIDAEPVTGGLKVFIVVEELPKLSGIEFKGYKQIKEKDLRAELVDIGVGGYISPFLIRDKKNKLAELYAERGYFQAEITHELIYNEDSTEASLLFKIDEKSKVKVEKVVMTGNKRVKAGDLIKKMRNRSRGFLKTSDFAQDKYDEDLVKVIDEYHKRGFIDAYLVSDSIAIDTTRNRMTIFLEVYEGPRYYFGASTFEGNNVINTRFLKRMMKYDEGDVFDKEKYDKSIEEIYTGYYQIGHLHTRVNDIRTTRQDSIIDIKYEISEGLPSHIRMINIVGNYKTKEKVIRRELKVYPGEVFNQARLIRSIRDVMALNYFEQAIPEPIALPNGDVDIEFTVKEKRTGEIMAGAGYNSQDKLVGNVGLGIPNFRGNGQNLALNIEFGRRRNSFSLSFTEPWMFGRPTLLGVSGFMVNRRWYTDYTEGRQGGSVRVGRRLSWPDNFFRMYASYSLERNRFYDFDELFKARNSYKASYYYRGPTSDVLLKQDYYGPYPGSVTAYNEEWRLSSRFAVNITRDSRDLPQFATSGSRLSYTFEHTGGILGGVWHYEKHSIDLAKFFPLFWGMSIAGKIQYGVVTSPSGDDRILLSDRFTPGGTDFDGTVRGYDGGVLTPDSLVTSSDTAFYYNDPNALLGIDPPDDTLFTSFRTKVRGKYMIVANLELQIPISQQSIYGLVFFDAGNSWLHRDDIKPITGLYRGIGLGFRVAVPGIGTLGFDFGYSLDDFDGLGKGWKPHFQYGSTFR